MHLVVLNLGQVKKTTSEWTLPFQTTTPPQRKDIELKLIVEAPSTRGRKPRLVGENSDNSSHREDDDPEERHGYTNVRVRSAVFKETCTCANSSLLPELLQGVPNTGHQNVWFMHAVHPGTSQGMGQLGSGPGLRPQWGLVSF
ncbi:hypothetical protein TNCV_3946461 [Trichonephila clavipes]|nr:hypothetical protein TNCV_3946461 [Trichonephila clavipes]